MYVIDTTEPIQVATTEIADARLVIYVLLTTLRRN